MQTYWDLTEKERAALSREDVQRFVDAELMLKGVLAAGALEIVPVPALPVASVTVYRPRSKTAFSARDIAFATQDQATAFLALGPAIIDKDWQLGDTEIFTPYGESTIEATPVITRVTADASKSILQSIKAAKDENERRRRAFDEQSKKVDSALQGLWDDWHSCGAKAMRIRAINATREKYLQLSGGDEETARRFLVLVHSEAELAEAAEWGGDKPPSPPTPARPATTNEIPF